ncbi:unnamed protein product, partial [Prorocentrum cordatum]
ALSVRGTIALEQPNTSSMYKYPRVADVLAKFNFQMASFRMIAFGATPWKPTLCAMSTHLVDWAQCFEIEAKLKAKEVVAEIKQH